MNKNITAAMIQSEDVSRPFTFIGSMDPKHVMDEDQYKNAVYELFTKLRIQCKYAVIDLSFYDTDYFRMK